MLWQFLLYFILCALAGSLLTEVVSSSNMGLDPFSPLHACFGGALSPRQSLYVPQVGTSPSFKINFDLPEPWWVGQLVSCGCHAHLPLRLSFSLTLSLYYIYERTYRRRALLMTLSHCAERTSMVHNPLPKTRLSNCLVRGWWTWGRRSANQKSRADGRTSIQGIEANEDSPHAWACCTFENIMKTLRNSL